MELFHYPSGNPSTTPSAETTAHKNKTPTDTALTTTLADPTTVATPSSPTLASTPAATTIVETPSASPSPPNGKYERSSPPVGKMRNLNPISIEKLNLSDKFQIAIRYTV